MFSVEQLEAVGFGIENARKIVTHESTERILHFNDANYVLLQHIDHHLCQFHIYTWPRHMRYGDHVIVVAILRKIQRHISWSL